MAHLSRFLGESVTDEERAEWQGPAERHLLDSTVAGSMPFLEAAPAKPFLRWAGGKSRLLSAILPHVPETMGSYHEPFLGSGALFFAVRGRVAGSVYLSDLNDELVNIWSVVQSRPEAFLDALAYYAGKNSEDQYYEVRDGEAPTGALERAARFFYLNQTAWNGLWRVNRWGRFNVPWGDRPFRGISKDQLMSATSALEGVIIANTDFRASLARAQLGDFVYLDPPYLPVSDTSKFAGYTQIRFRRADLAELSEICRDLTARGVMWAMSNRDTDAVRELFHGNHFVRFTTRRSVAAQNRRDVQPRESPEIIVLGGMPA